MNHKKHTALLLLTLISVKTLLVPVVYLDFELKKDFIIKNLCENRFKPQLKCNGQCILAKKLHQLAEDNATKETQKQSQAIKKILEEFFEITSLFSFELTYSEISKKPIYSYHLAHYHSFAFSIFHPPTI